MKSLTSPAYDVIYGRPLNLTSYNEYDLIIIIAIVLQAEAFPSCSQFHQHFMNSFEVDILLPKNYKAKL